MSNRMATRLAVLAAAGAVAGAGLLSASTGAAMASPTPGTTGPGTWSFDPGTGHNAITTTGGGSPTTQYQAQVQQPINADGSSVFSAKSRTIPVKFKVQSQTCTPGSTTVYPDTLESDASAYSQVPSGTPYGNLGVTPAGSFTVSQISNLTAHFTWGIGNNHGGSLRWQIDTPDGVVDVYYGSTSDSFQSGTDGSGTNMWSQDARFEGEPNSGGTGFAGSPLYDTLANVLNRSAPAGTVGQEPVTRIALIVDAGWQSGQGFDPTQQVKVQDATVTVGSETDTYTPGKVSSAPNCTGWAPDTTDPMWVYLKEVNGNTPGQVVDEELNSTQGDTGGQYRVVDGMYMYNFPVSNLPDPTATYQIGISPVKNGAPIGTPVPFGTK